MSRVLVVDNDNMVADICRLALDAIGHQVTCVDSGEVAIEIVSKEDYQLIIINHYLEGMNGIELFQRIRNETPSLRGILIAELDSVDTALLAMNTGFNRICTFPLDQKDIFEAVRDTLEIAQLRDGLTRLNTLAPLYNLTQRFLSAETEKQLFEELVETVSSEIGVCHVSVMMFDKEEGVLKVTAYRGLQEKFVKDLEVRPGDKISGKVFLNKRPIILNKVTQHLSPYISLLQRKELQASISFPIMNKGMVLGVLNVSETQTGAQFMEADLELLSIISDQAMMALENMRESREREEQARVRAMLEQYVSPEVSQILVTTRNELMDVGDVLDLTILFADIRNFTMLVQHVPPVELRDFLNTFFENFASIVFNHGGMLDKFMGDAALVVFGGPVEVTEPSRSAVQMAAQLMAKFETLAASRRSAYDVFGQIGLSVGISRGPVFLGNIGSSKRVDYTVIGTDVNIAQRLASETESGQILLTNRVADDLRGEILLSDGREMTLRGVDETLVVYSLPKDHRLV